MSNFVCLKNILLVFCLFSLSENVITHLSPSLSKDIFSGNRFLDFAVVWCRNFLITYPVLGFLNLWFIVFYGFSKIGIFFFKFASVLLTHSYYSTTITCMLGLLNLSFICLTFYIFHAFALHASVWLNSFDQFWFINSISMFILLLL